MGRASRRKRTPKAKTDPAMTAVTEAIGWVREHPEQAAKRIAELERAMTVNYGLVRALTVRAGGSAVLPSAEWMATEPPLLIEHDEQQSVTLTVVQQT